MAKKTFDTEATTGKFFTKVNTPPEPAFTQDKPDTQDKPNKHSLDEKAAEFQARLGISQKQQGRPKLDDTEKLRGYRYNLNLDRDLKPFLHEIVWQKRTSITQYINDLIRAEMEAYIAEGGNIEGWEND